MSTRLLKHLRNLTGLSMDDIGEIAHVDAHYICYAERYGDHLGGGQGERLSKTLGWMGNPEQLCMSIDAIDGFESMVDFERLEKLKRLARKPRGAREAM